MLPGLVHIGIATRTLESNPWYDRLLTSLQARSAGVTAEILVEAAPELTKVEKRLRLFRRSSARYLCILEDDTEILHEDWLIRMITHLSAVPNAALMNPQETRASREEVALAVLKDEVQEITNVAGFCMVVDRTSGIEPDVRVQLLDDLWMSLRARAGGFRTARSCGALVRHTKLPWAKDDVCPWEQDDRSRWGEEDAYYDRSRHEAKRRLEARLMVETFGDVARRTLPPELLPWADPLHPDFRMAWECGQPVAYMAEFQVEKVKIGGTTSEEAAVGEIQGELGA